MYVGVFLFSFGGPITCREVVQMSEQYSDQMWARSQRYRRAQNEERLWVNERRNILRSDCKMRSWVTEFHFFYSKFDLKNSPQLMILLLLMQPNCADLYPLSDGVVWWRPAVLLVVETWAFGGPVGVILRGGGDLLWGNFPRLHTEWLHTGETCQRQKISINKSPKQTSS